MTPGCGAPETARKRRRTLRVSLDPTCVLAMLHGRPTHIHEHLPFLALCVHLCMPSHPCQISIRAQQIPESLQE